MLRLWLKNTTFKCRSREQNAAPQLRQQNRMCYVRKQHAKGIRAGPACKSQLVSTEVAREVARDARFGSSSSKCATVKRRSSVPSASSKTIILKREFDVRIVRYTSASKAASLLAKLSSAQICARGSVLCSIVGSSAQSVMRRVVRSVNLLRRAEQTRDPGTRKQAQIGCRGADGAVGAACVVGGGVSARVA